MSDLSDNELLRQFARNRSEAAFAELVERHIGLVYSTALRMTGNPQESQDITQAVFIMLARKANSLGPKTTLPGWLHHTARFTAANLRRSELRRARREQESCLQSTMDEKADALWRELSPLLDDAVASLSPNERDVIVLRFFQERSLAEVGAALGASEDATRMRVNRALEKMRRYFARRGLTVSSASMAGTISANSAHAVPAGLAAMVSANVFSGATLTTAAVVAATKAITMTTLQKATIAAVLAATVGMGIFEARQNAASQKLAQNLQEQQNSSDEQLAQLQRERDEATNRLASAIAARDQLKSNPNERELLKLRGEVTALRAAANAPGKGRSAADKPDPSQAEARRNQIRANLDTFIKLANLSPEKADQYVNLEAEMKQRQDDRMAALLNGTLSVDEAARQRDQDNQEQQDQRREILGPDGWHVLQSIAEDMRDGAAKHLTDAVQANMGANPLTQEQGAQLQSAIKVEVAANTMDDTDLFRPVDQWTQMVTDQEQRVLQAASQFLSPAQLGTFQTLEQENLQLLLQQRDQRRKALGISQ